jgi:hypothetical protein
MSSRERILSVVVVALVVVVGGWQVWQRLLVRPLATKEELVRQLREQGRLKNRDVERLRQAAAELETWRRRSLPPDATLAPSLYQAWLTGQAEKAGFSGLEVRLQGTPTTNRGREVVYYRYPFRIKGNTSLEGLVNFLHAFYDAPLLQQVLQININPATSGRTAGGLEVALVVEGLALVDAEQWVIVPTGTDPASVKLGSGVDGRVYRGRRQRQQAIERELNKHAGHELVKVVPTTLVPERAASEAEDEAPSRLALAERAAYTPIVERNFFSPYQAPVAEPSGPDEAEYYRLTAVRAVVRPGREVPEAVLYSPLDDDYVALRAGEEFEVADVRGRVVSIGVRDVTLEIDDEHRLLRLGRSLRDLERIAGQAAAAEANDGAPANEEPSEESPAQEP